MSPPPWAAVERRNSAARRVSHSTVVFIFILGVWAGVGLIFDRGGSEAHSHFNDNHSHFEKINVYILCFIASTVRKAIDDRKSAPATVDCLL